MLAREHLASMGVSMSQAHDFIMGNLNSPSTIYQVARQFGVDSQMLADILAIEMPGLSAETVENFFSAQGFNGAALHATATSTKPSLLGSTFQPLAALVGLNTSSGLLSTETLRTQVTAVTGLNAYKYAFSPANFKGSEDGVFSAQDLGLSGVGEFAATWQNVESLYYGTIIRMLQSIDEAEGNTLMDFYDTHQAALQRQDPVVAAQMRSMFIDMMASPANGPVISDSELAPELVDVTQTLVSFMGKTTTSPLSNYIDIMVG